MLDTLVAEVLGVYLVLVGTGAKVDGTASQQLQAERIEGQHSALEVESLEEQGSSQQKLNSLEQQWTEKLFAVTKQRDELSRENSGLRDAYEAAKQSHSTELDGLRVQFNHVTAERDDLQQQFAEERAENLTLVDQLQDDRRKQSQENAELRQQLAVAEQADNELVRLRRRCSMFESAYQSSQSHSEQLLDSVNIPADDVDVSETKLGGGAYGGEYAQLMSYVLY